MAEQPQGFARRMMAQKLMTDARNTPGSDSPFFAGRIRPSMADIEQPTRISDMAGPAMVQRLLAHWLFPVLALLM